MGLRQDSLTLIDILPVPKKSKTSKPNSGFDSLHNSIRKRPDEGPIDNMIGITIEKTLTQKSFEAKEPEQGPSTTRSQNKDVSNFTIHDIKEKYDLITKQERIVKMSEIVQNLKDKNRDYFRGKQLQFENNSTYI